MVVDPTHRLARWQRFWDKQAAGYDKHMTFLDRVLFCDTRSWICSRARGQVLEVAVGTGLNLGHYPVGTSLTGIELSPDMLAQAHTRAADVRPDAHLTLGDAHAPYSRFRVLRARYQMPAIPEKKLAFDRTSSARRLLRSTGRLFVKSISFEVGFLCR